MQGFSKENCKLEFGKAITGDLERLSRTFRLVKDNLAQYAWRVQET